MEVRSLGTQGFNFLEYSRKLQEKETEGSSSLAEILDDKTNDVKNQNLESVITQPFDLSSLKDSLLKNLGEAKDLLALVKKQAAGSAENLVQAQGNTSAYGVKNLSEE